jgi:hypothetical protein
MKLCQFDLKFLSFFPENCRPPIEMFSQLIQTSFRTGSFHLLLGKLLGTLGNFFCWELWVTFSVGNFGELFLLGTLWNFFCWELWGTFSVGNLGELLLFVQTKLSELVLGFNLLAGTNFVSISTSHFCQTSSPCLEKKFLFSQIWCFQTINLSQKKSILVIWPQKTQ